MARIIICKDCGRERPNHGRGLCSGCYNRKWREDNPEYDKEWYKENREARLEYCRNWCKENPDTTREHHIKHTYGLTLADYDKMLEAQSGVCAICGVSPEEGGRRLLVDHDHKTGKIRGLLCYSCNVGLGHFKDSPHNLAEAIEYLLD